MGSDAVSVPLGTGPLETGLPAAASARGHRIFDGVRMLLRQEGCEFRKWFGATSVVAPEQRALIGADLEATSPRRCPFAPSFISVAHERAEIEPRTERILERDTRAPKPGFLGIEHRGVA